jgi:glycosyltransferase involved in cell wall biosynthesis
VLYWPNATLAPVHIQKDPGGISAALAAMDRKTLLIVGTAESDSPPGVELVDCTRLGARTPLDEFRLVSKLLRDRRPSHVVLLRNRHAFAWTVLLGRLARLGPADRSSGGRRTRWILKLDTDGLAANGWERWGSALFLLFVSVLFDRVVIESSCGYRRLRHCIPWRDKLLFVPDGYSSSLFRPIPHILPSRTPTILSVGRVAPVKGIRTLVDAFGRIAAAHPEWHLRVVGPIEDERYRAEVEEQVRSMHLQGRIRLVGAVSREALLAEYRSASIFCLLSERESFGIVRAEAVVSGLPVVTSEAGCRHDMEQMGFRVVPIGDAVASARALGELASDPELRARLVEIGQAEIRSWDQVTRAILEGTPGTFF